MRMLPYFFFFQAEDGIRDRNVTGVQTCALPILGLHDVNGVVILEKIIYGNNYSVDIVKAHEEEIIAAWKAWWDGSAGAPDYTSYRSEERRVGKEWRSRWLGCTGRDRGETRRRRK